jgi:hypothetical protein
MTTTHHCCISLNGLLKLTLEGHYDFLERDDGTFLKETEIYQLVKEEKAKGYKYFCGCDKRDEEGRCIGHEANK